MVNSWVEQGMANPKTGKLAKVIPAGHILIPGKIWLENEYLNWQAWGERDSEGATDRPPQRELLDEFARICGAADFAAASQKLSEEEKGMRRRAALERDVLSFAKKHGPLSKEMDFLEGREHISMWRQQSRRVCAVLNICAELDFKKKSTAEQRRFLLKEWKFVGVFEKEHLGQLQSSRASFAQLEREAQRWVSGVRFSVKWNRESDRFGLEVDYSGRMVNALGLQIALAISNSDSLYICSACGLPYSRSRKTRKPNPGHGNFCDSDDCGKAAARQQADARRRAKVSEARKLQAEGVTPAAIAKQLDTTTASVNRWLKKKRKV